MSQIGRQLYELFSQLPHDVELRVGEIGCEGNICLDCLHDGETVGIPLFELTPEGELVEQVTERSVEIGPIEALKEELGRK